MILFFGGGVENPDGLGRVRLTVEARCDHCKTMWAEQSILLQLSYPHRDRIEAELMESIRVHIARAAFVAHGAVAVRIANLARRLPNPQPAKLPVFEFGHDPARSDIADALACVWASKKARFRPAPTHALRLYVDALMIVEGEGVLSRFLCANQWWWDHSECAGNTFSYPSPALPVSAGVRVYDDGRVVCGPELPELPILTYKQPKS